MTHPSDYDLDELEGLLIAPGSLSVVTLRMTRGAADRYLRAIQSMRRHNNDLQELVLEQDEETDASPTEDLSFEEKLINLMREAEAAVKAKESGNG